MNSTMDVLNHQYVLTYIFVLLFIAAKWHRDIYKTVYLWNNQQQLEEHSNNEKEKKNPTTKQSKSQFNCSARRQSTLRA